ncbi:MAG: patatin-like phospholipase family protein [Spirochaetales bacterium]|nr:patatin-like phospholipase family protein [Candidatus Physcosoma equi]
MWNFFRKPQEKEKEIRYILTIDGGGMRGIVPAYILKRMDQLLKEEEGTRPLYSYFDLIAGTSTGGLISLALTAPLEETNFRQDDGPEYLAQHTETITEGFFHKKKEVTVTDGTVERLGEPEDILSLYSKNGGRIFEIRDDKGSLWTMVKQTVHRFFKDKYDASNFEEFLLEMMGDTELKDAKVPTMAVAFNCDNCSPYIFRSWDSHGFLLREAARATSAAPTYFAPITYIDRETEERVTLVDGGIGANNPILTAYIEARKLYPNADEFHILSLSTAAPFPKVEPENFATNIDWMGALMSAYSAGNMNVSLQGVEAIPGVKVTRIWEPVIDHHIPLDDASPEAVSVLLKAAETIYTMQEKEIVAYVEEMKKAPLHQDAVKLKKTLALPREEESKELPED